MTSDNKDDSVGAVEVTPEMWERVKGILMKFEAALEDAAGLPSRSRQRDVEVWESGRSLEHVDRLSIIKALIGTIALIDDLFPGQGALRWPLIRICNALGSVDLCLETDPLLQADRKQKRPPQGLAVQRLKGEAAAALELFHRSGQNLKPAADEVVRKIQTRDLTAIGYKVPTHQEINGRTVMDWRFELKNSTARSIEVERYNEILEFFQGLGGDEATRAAENVLTIMLTAPKKSGLR